MSDERLFVRYKGNDYLLKETVKPKRQPPQKQKANSERKPHKPAPNHPWRIKPKLLEGVYAELRVLMN